MKEDKNFLGDLINAISPSGYEKLGTDVFDKWVGENTRATHVLRDRNYNSLWSLGNGDIKVLLTAHIDEISGIVQSIDESGLVSIINVGGMDRKVVYGSSVCILKDDDSFINGYVCHKPIHLQENEEYEKSDKFKDLKIDLGCESKKEVLALGVHPGLKVVNRRDYDMDFGNNRLRGNALDDKSCCYILGQVGKKLSSLDPELPIFKKYTFIFGVVGCEETGLENARIVAQNINPDISIDLDVTFGGKRDGLCPEEDGEAELGKGCVIMYGPDKNPSITKILRRVAEEKKILYQEQASRAGGTNTASFKNFSLNCASALISIPDANMHQVNEIEDWRDIDSAISLLYETLICGYLE